MRMTKIYWKRFRSPLALATGTLLGVAMTAASAFGSLYRDQAAAVPTDRVEAAPSTNLLDKFSGLRIVSSAVIGPHAYFSFSDETGQTVTSRQLAAQGVTVTRQSACAATLAARNQQIDVYCY